MTSKEVVIGKREKPDFVAMTAGKAMFAVVGAVAMVSAGNDIVAKYNVEDPAGYIAGSLSAALSAKYGSKNSAKSVVLTDDDIDAIARRHPGIEVLLDIRTTGWSFGYFPTTWDKYRVIYGARLRLIDVKGGKVIAEGACSRVPDQTPNSPTYEELLARNAERLKKELKEAAEFCIGDFKTNVLQL